MNDESTPRESAEKKNVSHDNQIHHSETKKTQKNYEQLDYWYPVGERVHAEHMCVLWNEIEEEAKQIVLLFDDVWICASIHRLSLWPWTNVFCVWFLYVSHLFAPILAVSFDGRLIHHRILHIGSTLLTLLTLLLSVSLHSLVAINHQYHIYRSECKLMHNNLIDFLSSCFSLSNIYSRTKRIRLLAKPFVT